MQKKHQYYSLIASLLLWSAVSNAQSGITLSAAQDFTTFRFENSNGQQDKDYHGVYSGSYGFGFRHIGAKGFMYRILIGMNNGGATLIYDAMNYNWQLKYATAQAGIGWAFGHAKARPYMVLSPYYSMLLKGSQRLNNMDFDILQSKDIADSDYGVAAAPGLDYALSENISIYVEAEYRMGLKDIEPDEQQCTNNRSAGLKLGVAINLGKK